MIYLRLMSFGLTVGGRAARSVRHLHPCLDRLQPKECLMSKEQRGNREAKKPEKSQPRINAAAPQCLADAAKSSAATRPMIGPKA